MKQQRLLSLFLFVCMSISFIHAQEKMHNDYDFESSDLIINLTLLDSLTSKKLTRHKVFFHIEHRNKTMRKFRKEDLLFDPIISDTLGVVSFLLPPANKNFNRFVIIDKIVTSEGKVYNVDIDQQLSNFTNQDVVIKLNLDKIQIEEYSYSPLEIVKLKNGSVIKGYITEQIPNQYIKLQTSDGNLFVFKPDEIDNITKIRLEAKQSYKKKTGGYFYSTSFFNLGVGTDAENTFMTGAKIIVGNQFNRKLAIGIGSGFSYMGATGGGNGHINFIPLYTDVRINFTNKDASPYLFINPGYGFVAGASGAGEFSGGFYFNTGLGIRGKLNENSDLDFSLSYMSQKTKWEYDYSFSYYDSYSHSYRISNIHSESVIKANYISVMLGLYFM